MKGVRMINNWNSIKQEDAIWEIQLYLRNISNEHNEIPKIIITGIYDSKTKEAVAKFQELAGLPVTEKVDFKTWQALVKENSIHAHAKEMPLKVPCCSYDFNEIKNGYEGDMVYAIKIMLNNFNRKYKNYSKLEISNKYDKETEEAISLFQKTSMLPVTGTVDKTTWNTLVSIYEICKLYSY